MTAFDGFVLDITERVCRRIQLLTGRTNVWLAGQLTNLSIVVYFIWAGASFLSSDWPIRVALGMFCGGVLYALTQTVLEVPVETSEQSAYQRVARGYRNPRRVRDAMLRLVFLALALMLAGPVALVHVTLEMRLVLLAYSLVVLTTILLYVLACDPLPPCAGSVTAWVRRLGRSRAASSAEGVWRTRRRAAAQALHGARPATTRRPSPRAPHRP
jgi:hypothetical protein